MKRCPECRRDYTDDSLLYCLEDGTALVQGSVPSPDEPQTAILHETASPMEAATRAQIHTTEAERVGNLSEPSDGHNIPAPELAGNVGTPRTSAHPAAKRRAGFDRRLIAAPIVALILAVGVYVGSRYFGPSTNQIDSIAVMPFVNESGNADVEYVSDGMTETLISGLTQIPSLSVKARSSVFRYKGKDMDAKTLGSELGVQAILNGRLAQRADQLIVSLELVDATTENAIWSQQYTRNQSDLVSLQSEITRDVLQKLKSRLSGSETAKVGKTLPDNPEAYQLYLKGRFYWNKRTPEALAQAIEYFNQAVAKDPNYALAYSGLAESYVLCPNFSVAPPIDCMPKAKTAALRALELDDSLAEAHTALGIYYSNFAWNQAAAEREFRRAIAVNSNYPSAHQQYGIECLTAVGRFDEAIAQGRKAVELDPFSPIISADLGNSLLRARRFDEAVEQLNRALALDPNFYVARYYLGSALHGKGSYPEAVEEYRKAAALNRDPWVRAQLARSLVRAGNRDGASKLLRELQGESTSRYVSSASLALVYGALGDKDKAFELLEKEIAERTSRAQLFSVNPLWDDLRDDPRFVELVRRVEAAKID